LILQQQDSKKDAKGKDDWCAWTFTRHTIRGEYSQLIAINKIESAYVEGHNVYVYLSGQNLMVRSLASYSVAMDALDQLDRIINDYYDRDKDK
jgi:hypothetical protein